MNVRTGFPWWLRPFLQKDVVAITLWRRVYVSEKLAGEALQRILAHELVHVRQIEHVGLIRFYWRYLREYVGNRRAGMPPHEAYRRISFEQEALIIERSVTDENA